MALPIRYTVCKRRKNNTECYEDIGKAIGGRDSHTSLLGWDSVFTDFPGWFLIVPFKISHEDDNYMAMLLIEKVTFELISKKASGSLPAGEWVVQERRRLL